MLVAMREKTEKSRKISRAPRIRVPNNERDYSPSIPRSLLEFFNVYL